MNSQQQQCCRGFAAADSHIFAYRPALFLTLSLVNVQGCHFLGSKPVNCCLLAMFELFWAEWPLRNIFFGLTAAPPHGDILSALRPRPIMAIFSFALWPCPLTAIFPLALRPCPITAIFPSALRPRPLTAIFLRPYGRAPSRRYSFGLTAAPPHGNIPSVLRPRPLTAIFLRPHRRAPSRRGCTGVFSR